MQMPQRHQDTNPDNYLDHKELIFNDLHLAYLRVFVTWWQKRTYRSRLNLRPLIINR
jgi:hypothetical protein